MTTKARYEKALEYLRLAHEEISVVAAQARSERKFGEVGDAQSFLAQIEAIISQDHGQAGLSALIKSMRTK